jgi:hypothetical protein
MSYAYTIPCPMHIPYNDSETRFPIFDEGKAFTLVSIADVVDASVTDTVNPIVSDFIKGKSPTLQGIP